MKGDVEEMFLRLTIALFFLLCSAVSVAHETVSNTSDNMVVLGVVEFPPLVIKNNENNTCYGKAVTISTSLLNDMGYKVRVVCPPPARLFESLRTGKVDLTINVKGTTALDNNVTFVEKPFSYLSILLLTNPKLESDKTVSAIRGYDYEGMRKELLEDDYIIFDMANSSDAIQLFQFGRTTHLVTYEAPYDYYMQQSPDSITEHIVSKELNIPTYFAISKASKLSHQLQQSFTRLFSSSDAATIIENTSKTNK